VLGVVVTRRTKRAFAATDAARASRVAQDQAERAEAEMTEAGRQEVMLAELQANAVKL
jgi:hypothetical protein